jgi:DNA-binding transcriptional ArsR family regulator
MDDQQASQIARALAHPLRIGLLRAIREERRLSPSAYAQQTGEPLGNVSYHVRALESAGVVEIVGTANRRGALEHFYAPGGTNSGTALAILDLLAIA